MSKKNTSRKLRRHPQLLNQIVAMSGKNQHGVDRIYRAALEDLPQHRCSIPPQPHGTFQCPECAGFYWADGHQWWATPTTSLSS